jgi:sugar lactone lactonase YvrE
MRSVSVLVVALLAAFGLVSAAAPAKKGKSGKSPSVIALPNGWQPEGIASGPGRSLYVGSIPTGSIDVADTKTGRGDVLVNKTDRSAIGIKVDKGRIYVAGGATGRAFVYDARTGADIADVRLTDAPTFVNDVTLTKDAAYFTDSQRRQLYRLDRRTNTATTIPITGDLQYDDDPQTFEANGIAASPDGRTLYVVQSRTGQLFTVDAATGASKLVLGDLPNADGILLKGKTLYVVQNRVNLVAVVDLKRRRVVNRLSDSDFKVPTTIARQNGSLYVVNARFGTPPAPDTEYQIVRVGR